MTAQEGQRGGVSAVVHLAGELFRLEEGDVLGVGDDELTLGLGRRHHQLTQNSLRLLRRVDASDQQEALGGLFRELLLHARSLLSGR